MSATILWIVVLIVSLVVLVKSADYFTQYSEKIGLALGLSSFIVGATIVAIGTSLPELITSMFAVLGSGVTEFVADNVIGSNIANALLILGFGAMYARTIKVKTALIDIDLPFFFMSMALFVFFALDRVIARGEGIFLLALFVVFMIYSARPDESKAELDEDKSGMDELRAEYLEAWEAKLIKKSETSAAAKQNIPYTKYIAVIVVSAAFLAGASKFLIDAVLNLSTILGITSTLLTITVVAVGTSMPEIITSILAIRRGNHAIALGNVFGSNTFNLLFIVGLPSLWGSLAIAELTFIVGVPFLILATLAAIFTSLDNKIRYWEGAAMLFLYFVFLAKVVEII